MGSTSFLYRLSSIALVFALLCACSPQITVHGYVPSEEEIASIEPGVDTVLSIEERIGRPSSSGLLRDSDWYYVQTTMEQLTYNPARATDRIVVAMSFDEDGVVESVQRYGLEDGQIVNLSPRVTQTGGQRVNTLRQIFSGLLNFDAGSFLDN
ncbi:MAG: outer membrane protein assembly factor BamE [Pseudomonadota bacterium]